MQKYFQHFATFIIPSRVFDDLLLNCIERIRFLYPETRIIAVLDQNARAPSFPTSSGVTILYPPTNTISGKRNAGAASAKTKYLAFIDSDAYPNAGWLENAIDFLDNNFEYGLATGSQTNFPTDTPMSQAIRRLRLSPLFSSYEYIRFYDGKMERQDCQVVCSANLLVNREKYFAVGGMNERLYIGEDGDFSQRFNKAGIKMIFLPEMSICHKEREYVPFLRQRYTFCYSIPINLLRGLNTKFNIVAMGPLLGVVFLVILSFIFSSYKIPLEWLLLFPLIVLLALCFECLRIGRNLRECCRLLFVFSSIYLIWMFALIWGTLRLPPKPEDVYFHN